MDSLSYIEINKINYVMNIGILVIAYNRVESLKRLLYSLNISYYDRNDICLIISIDKGDNRDVVTYANSFEWRHGVKNIIVHKENLGLRKHVLLCGSYLKEYDALVILEDDIFVAPSFFLFAKSAVDYYHLDSRIAGISLYSFFLNYQTNMPFIPEKRDADVYFMSCAQSWGQVWLKNQWEEFMKWYDKHEKDPWDDAKLPKAICNWPKSSWLKYHTRYCIEREKYFVYPYVSYTTNFSDKGTHVKSLNTAYQVPLQQGVLSSFKFVILDNKAVVYDGYFERLGLGYHLNMSENSLCVNFYDEKKMDGYRYLLSTKKLPYKIVKSFALNLKPYELNIYYNLLGSDLFLYDTSNKALKVKDRYTIEEKSKYLWSYSSLSVLHVSVSNMLREIVRRWIKMLFKRLC